MLNIGNLSADMTMVTVSMLMSFVTPFVVAIFVNMKMSKQTRSLVTLALCLVMAVIGAKLTGRLNDVSNVMAMWAMIVPTAAAIYRNFGQSLGVEKLEWLTSSTESRAIMDAPSGIDRPNQ